MGQKEIHSKRILRKRWVDRTYGQLIQLNKPTATKFSMTHKGKFENALILLVCWDAMPRQAPTPFEKVKSQHLGGRIDTWMVSCGAPT